MGLNDLLYSELDLTAPKFLTRLTMQDSVKKIPPVGRSWSSISGHLLLQSERSLDRAESIVTSAHLLVPFLYDLDWWQVNMKERCEEGEGL